MKYLEAKRKRDEEEEARKSGRKSIRSAPENKMQPPPEDKADAHEWPMAMSPERYLALNADSENPSVQERVSLAREILGRADD